MSKFNIRCLKEDIVWGYYVREIKIFILLLSKFLIFNFKNHPKFNNLNLIFALNFIIIYIYLNL
jgi:hypothetical protein